MPAKTPFPSPSPKVESLVSHFGPKILAALDQIPSPFWAVAGFVASWMFQKVAEAFAERKTQTIKATMLELFSDFAEKQDALLRGYYEATNKKSTENMIEIAKLIRKTESIEEKQDEVSLKLDKVIDNTTDHERRLHKIEVWRQTGK